MNRTLAFSKRVFLELIRDPLSYIFCLGFPIVMLIAMTLVNSSIPAEAGITTFRIDSLSGGIAVFGLMFTMLFTCLIFSKDRGGSFLVRLYATPMRSRDFIAGYLLPMVLLSVIQVIIAFAASFIVSLIVGSPLSIPGLLMAVLSLTGTYILMISLGLLFGTLFNEKAAPGLCSIIISLGSFLGGIFFNPDGTGGVLLSICQALPFYHSVKTARLAAALDFSADFFIHLLIVWIYAVCTLLITVLSFRHRMKADLG